VRAGLDLEAGRTRPAGVEGRLAGALAEQALGQPQGERVLADALRADEEKRMRKSPLGQPRRKSATIRSWPRTDPQGTLHLVL